MSPTPENPNADRVELEPLEAQAEDSAAITSQALVDRIPIVITVELGQTTVSVKELKNLRKGQIVGLDKAIGDTLDIFANGQKLASGEVVAIGQERYGIRVVSLVEEGDQSGELFP
ncbi:FliM/FliN family flagellar motor switch protein [Acidisoma sp. C75]